MANQDRCDEIDAVVVRERSEGQRSEHGEDRTRGYRVDVEYEIERLEIGYGGHDQVVFVYRKSRSRTFYTVVGTYHPVSFYTHSQHITH